MIIKKDTETTVDFTAGKFTVENKTKNPITVAIYVPNKDNLPVILEGEASFTVTTTTAGETAHYLSQAIEDVLSVTVAG